MNLKDTIILLKDIFDDVGDVPLKNLDGKTLSDAIFEDDCVELYFDNITDEGQEE